MAEWWNGLSGLGRALLYGAVFFSVLFLWQLLSALLGATFDAEVHDGDLDTSADGHDGADSVEAFRLLSVRSIVTFFTLFTWGGALYLGEGLSTGKAMGLAALWGLAGMAVVAILLHWLPRLAETGTKDLASAVGARGTVYLDIPAQGVGEVRVLVSGVLTHAEARGVGGMAIKASSPVRVVRQLDAKSVEVEPLPEGTPS